MNAPPFPAVSVGPDVDPFAELQLIDEDAIVLLDRLTPQHLPDSDLLQGMPARDLNAATSALVEAFRSIDVDRVNRRFNWFERITGADIEARVRFDLATHEIDDLMQATVHAQMRAERARDRIARDSVHLDRTNSELGLLVEWANACLSRIGGEEFHRQRFVKRITDIEMIIAANRMMEGQYSLAHQTLTALVDRTGEVTRVLLPLWKQHAFAIAHSDDGPMQDKPRLDAFAAVHGKICALLSTKAG